MEIREVYNRVLGQGLVLTIQITDGLLFKSTGGSNIITLNLKTPSTPSYTGTMKYSKNNTPWQTYTMGTAITIEDQETVVFSGSGPYAGWSSTKNIQFTTTGTGNGRVIVSGNLSALNGNLEPVNFKNLFSGCTRIIDASLLNLNYTTLNESMYYGMFYSCVSLTGKPLLRASVMATSCYCKMFQKCSKLSTASYLTSYTLAPYCYAYMFDGCTSITGTTPLVATKLAEGCYLNMFERCTSLSSIDGNSFATSTTNSAAKCCQYMFSGCTALKVLPKINIATLAPSCYLGMFEGCRQLTGVTDQLNNIISVASASCYRMFKDCVSLSTVNSNNLTKVKYLEKDCYMYMFSGCTGLKSTGDNLFEEVLDTAPSCCYGMFENCYKLSAVPKFPIIETTLEYCYGNMYKGCSSLVTAQIMPSRILAPSCYQEMFSGCTALTSLTAYFPSWYASLLTAPATVTIAPTAIINYATSSDIPLTFISHGKNKIRLRRKEGPLYNDQTNEIVYEPLSTVNIMYSKNGGTWTQYKNTGNTNNLSTTVYNQVPTGVFILLNNGDTLAFKNTTNYFGGGILYFESLKIDANASIEVIGNIKSLINNNTTLQLNSGGTHSQGGYNTRQYDNFFFLFTGVKDLNARYLQLLPGTTYNGNRIPMSTWKNGTTATDIATASTYLYTCMFELRKQFTTFVPTACLPIFGTGTDATNDILNYYAAPSSYVYDDEYFSFNSARYTQNWTSGITTVGIFYKFDELDEIYNSDTGTKVEYVPTYTSYGTTFNIHPFLRYYIDSNNVSARPDNVTLSGSGASHFIPSAWHCEPILEKISYNWRGIVDNGDRDIIPLFKSGIFHHNGQYGNEDITYVYDEENSRVFVLDNEHYDGYVDPANPSNNIPSHVEYSVPQLGRWVQRAIGSEYFFLPMLSDPFSISATQAFKVNLSSRVSTHKKWVIRTTDPRGVLSSCNGVPLSAGMTLKSTNRENMLTTTSTFQANWTHIPIYCSAVIQNRDIPITRTTTGRIDPGYCSWESKELNAGSNIFLVPAYGLINFWNMTDRLNSSADKVDYQFVTCGSVLETFYGNTNSLRDHTIIPRTYEDFLAHSTDLPYRVTDLQAGAFKDLFKGNTNLARSRMNNIPALGNSENIGGISRLVPKDYCRNMFSGCTNLTVFTTPITSHVNIELGDYCYANMFANCTDLTSNGGSSNTYFYAEDVGNYSCYSMYKGCTMLDTVRMSISNGTKGIGSFESMFSGCTSLIDGSAISLDCSNLQKNLYKKMFNGCNVMKHPPYFDMTGDGSDIGLGALQQMFSGCTSLTGGEDLNSFFYSVMDNSKDIMASGLLETFAWCTNLTFPPISVSTSQEITTSERKVGFPVYCALITGGYNWSNITGSFPPVTGSMHPTYYDSYHLLTLNDTNAYTAPCDGWLRVSIRLFNFSVPDESTAGVEIDGVPVTLYQYNTNHTSVSFLLPVKSGSQIKWWGPSGYGSIGCCVFAAALDSSANGFGAVGYPDYSSYQSTANCEVWTLNTEKTPVLNGWLRVTTLNATLQGCVQLLQKTGNDWAGMELYGFAAGGNGTTFLLPIHKNCTYKVVSTVTPSGNNNKILILYAPDRGGYISYPTYTSDLGYHYSRDNLTRDVVNVIPMNGWVRLYVENNNNLNDGCLRITINGAAFDGAFPLYQFKTHGTGITYLLPVKKNDEFQYYCSLHGQTGTASCHAWFEANQGAYDGVTKNIMDDDIINEIYHMSFKNTHSSNTSFSGLFGNCYKLTYTPVLNITGVGRYDASDSGNRIFANCSAMQYVFIGQGINETVRYALPDSQITPRYIVVPLSWSYITSMPSSWNIIEYANYN